MQLPLRKEKVTRFGGEVGPLEESRIPLRIERRFVGRGGIGLPFREDDVVGISQPTARLLKIQMQMLHHQVDRPHRFRHADEAAAGVLPLKKEEALMMIVMEGAEALVARNSETESLGDPLNGEVAELL